MKVAAQLYTLRNLTKTREGFEECVRRVAEIGYEGVQLSAVGCMAGDAPEVDAADAKSLLDRYGLACCATHRPWDRLRNHADEEAEFHRTLGCGVAGLGMLPNQGDLPGFLPECVAVAQAFHERGLEFAYHNHEIEFSRLGGTLYFDALRDVPHLGFILDVYWAWVGGLDPARLLAELAGRVRCVHMKDLLPVGREVRFAPVGEGNLDWDAILGACRSAGTEWLVVEQDETYGRDPFDALASSHRFLAARSN